MSHRSTFFPEYSLKSESIFHFPPESPCVKNLISENFFLRSSVSVRRCLLLVERNTMAWLARIIVWRSDSRCNIFSVFLWAGMMAIQNIPHCSRRNVPIIGQLIPYPLSKACSPHWICMNASIFWEVSLGIIVITLSSPVILIMIEIFLSCLFEIRISFSRLFETLWKIFRSIPKESHELPRLSLSSQRTLFK